MVHVNTHALLLSLAPLLEFNSLSLNHPQERRVNARTQFNALCTCVHILRFLFHDESKVGAGGWLHQLS